MCNASERNGAWTMAERERKFLCQCNYCGKTFYAKHPSASCCGSEECNRKANTERMRKKREYKYQVRGTNYKRNAKAREQMWRELIREIEKSGLTYGQYVARRGK